ncbi:hypothetical protein MIR68_012526 [Amoeboaphelidium protococcarum]|nr:hypothetical protein MIR68_012526 [Amoeboaphelidium protococcarum]
MKTPLVLSGSSGVGKSTLLKKLFLDYPENFGFSVSHTTRNPRAGEQDGVDYHYVSVEKFKQLIADNHFLEYAQFGGNYYGTSVSAVNSVAQSGKICILDIDRQGVQNVKRLIDNPQSQFNSANFLFIAPPSVDELETRLRSRGTESEESVQKRMQSVKDDLAYSKQKNIYDKIIVNDNLERAYNEFKTYLEQIYGLKK